MKKTNEKVEQVNTKKCVRRKRMFFLFAQGKGFVRIEDDSVSMPNFDRGEILVLESKAMAVFVRSFFMRMKLADNIDILAKVA